MQLLLNMYLFECEWRHKIYQTKCTISNARKIINVYWALAVYQEFVLSHYFPYNNCAYHVNTVIILVIPVRKQRLKEVKCFAQGHTSREGKGGIGSQSYSRACTLSFAILLNCNPFLSALSWQPIPSALWEAFSKKYKASFSCLWSKLTWNHMKN